jgi:transposase
MGRVTRAMSHLSEEKIMQRLRLTLGSAEHRRWLVILNALIDPRPASEIAKHTGFKTSSVHDLVSNYNRFGPQAIESPKESKRRRCYLGKEEEIIFLSPFLERAQKGQIATATEIRRALEDLLKHSVHHSTIYRLLDRNGWRKVMPRPFHMQSREQIQEDFKKTFPKL